LPAQRLSNILYITNDYRMEADMLVLTRRVGESLTVGDEIKVTILGVKGNQVRVGIDAPRDLPVMREELKRRLEGETDDAS
jgi:carbon storage regulator